MFTSDQLQIGTLSITHFINYLICVLQSGDQDKGSRLSSEIAFVDAACKWVSEKMEKVSESNVPEATEDFVKVHIFQWNGFSELHLSMDNDFQDYAKYIWDIDCTPKCTKELCLLDLIYSILVARGQ